MRRTVRAVRASPARAVCLGIVCAASVAGSACVSAFAAGGDSRATTVVALAGIVLTVCLASAAIIVIGLRGQSDDLMLATVRGMSRGRMWRWLVAEPLLVVFISAIAGLVLGGVAVSLLVAAGRDRPDDLATVAASAAGCGFVSALTIAACCRFAAHAAPLRRGSTPVWLVAAEFLALVGAGWLLVHTAAAGHGEDPVLVACAPPAAALAVIVVSRWLVRGLGVVGMLATARTRSVERYLAMRQVRRTTVLATTFACVAGAVVMTVFGLSVRQAETQWRTDMATIATGGVTSYESDLSAAPTLLATRAADPDGRWLMAIEASATDVDADSYRGFADLTRWDRVLGSAWPGNDAGIGDTFATDAWDAITVRSGPVRVRVDNRLDWPRDEQPYLNLSLLRTDGEIVSAGLALHSDGDVINGNISGCDDGCVVRNLTFGTEAGAPATLGGRIVLQSMSVDGEPVTTGWKGDASPWNPDLRTIAAQGEPLRVRTTAAGLELRLDTHGLSEPVGLTPTSENRVRHVVAAGDTQIADRVLGLGSMTAPSDVAARARILPVIGDHGYLGNLPDVMLDSYEEAPGSRVRVLARDDTPAPVLSALSEHGVPTSDPTTAADVASRLADSDEGRAALAWNGLAAVVAVAAAAVAAYAYSAARPRTRIDAAGLRSAHVPASVSKAAARYEVGIVAVATTAAGFVVGLVTWWCTRDALVLAAPTRFDPTVDVSTRTALAGSVAAFALVLGAGSALLLRRRDLVAARPETLRRSDAR